MEKDLVKMVAAMLKEDPKMVASIVDTYEKYISDTIKSGKMENVRVPLFGVFQVNLRKLKYFNQIKPTL